MHLSDPLVSHHLATLLDAGLVERRRVSRSVEYRATTQGPAAQWIATLAAFVDASDPQRQRDRAERGRLAERRAPADSRAADVGRLDRALIDFAWDRLATAATQRPLRVCAESDRAAVLAALLPQAATSTVIASTSARAARLRRTLAAIAGITDLRVTTARGLSSERRFDMLIMDCVERPDAAALEAWLPRVMPRLQENHAQLLLFVAYDALGGDQSAEHPLLRLRRTLSQHGLQCEQIRPIEAEGRHLLAAAATLRAASGRRVA